MSQTSSGSGGSAAPGWYTDPHDPRQLRWWSGDGWTEHVSPQAQPVAEVAQAQPVAAQPVAAQPVAAQPVEPQPVFAQPVSAYPVSAYPAQAQPVAAQQPVQAQEAPAQPVQQAQPVQVPAVAPETVQPQPVQPQAVQPQAVQPQLAQPQAFGQPEAFAQPQQAATQDALPSRRALREPASDTTAGDAAAAASVAQQEQLAEQDRPLTFLEKQGYPATPGGTTGPSAPSAPAAPAQPNAWNQPVQPSEPVQPQAFAAQQPVVPSVAAPAAQPANAWEQPVQLVEPTQPAPAAQPNAWNQPVQDAAPVAPAAQGWNQPVADPGAPVAPALTPAEQLLAQSEAAQQNIAGIESYGQPTPAQQWALQPTSQQPGVPPIAAGATGTEGIDSLFGNTPAAAAVVEQGYTAQDATPAANAWGLSPSGRPAEEGTVTSESRGSQSRAESTSTVWSWLIAASPIIAALAIGYVLKAVGATFGWQLEAAFAAPYILVLLFAIADRGTLVRLGIDGAATWVFAALTAPIYLLMRASVTRRETGTGNGPLIGWFIALIVAAVGFVGFGLLTHAPLYPGLPG